MKITIPIDIRIEIIFIQMISEELDITIPIPKNINEAITAS